MSTATAAIEMPPAGQPTTLGAYRDDGPLARAIGSVLGRFVPLPPVALVAAGAIPLFAVMAIKGDTASKPLVAALIALFVLLGGIAQGRPLTDRLRWAVPPLIRLTEYGTLIWLGALAGSDSEPAAFALLCALTFRHYDLVYRLRHQGVAPPRWVGDVAGGWDGRLIVGFVLWAAGALPAGFFVAAGLLAVMLVGDSIAGWRRFGRAQQPVMYDDEEDEGQ
jgi:hypothetical protein